MYDPVIKWSGSKRSQAEQILSYFPQSIETYYEPFCGGCSVLRRLLSSHISVKRYICSDINNDLINVFHAIKTNPTELADYYESLWNKLNIDEDKTRKRAYFEMVRDRYNREHNPMDFLFIMRTTTNGMPRYNQRCEFNNSFHITRNGIMPQKLRNIINEWNVLLNQYDVQFVCQNFSVINTNANDFVYLDPPYAHTQGMYFGQFDQQQLWQWMRKQSAKYLLSYDGISGEVDNTYEVPKDLYSQHVYLLSGNSSFKRTIGKSNDSIVQESLYVK